MSKKMARRFGSPHASGEDLVAYADGDLAGQRRDLVEEHLRVCAWCRERLRAFDEVGRIVRAGAPLVDDPAGRASLHARLEAGNPRAAPPTRLPSVRLLVAVSSLALLLALLSWPLASEAGFPMGRFVRFGPVLGERNQKGEQKLRDVGSASVEDFDASFSAVEPSVLPLELGRVSRSVPKSGRIEVLYRSPAGLALLLAQTPADGQVVEMDSFGTQEVVLVGDTPVLRLTGARPDVVAGLLWEREGVTFELLVTEAPPEGLAASQAAAIVEAIIAAQDAGPR